MKKLILLFCIFLSFPIFAQNNTSIYNFDYNLANRIGRLWIDYEILMEYDVFENKAVHKDFIFEDGYLFEPKNDNFSEIGFYNNEQLVVDEKTYEMKISIVGKISVREKGNEKWIPLKKVKKTFKFTENSDNLPEVVKFWALKTALQQEIFFLERQIYKRVSIDPAIDKETNF